MRPKRRSSAPTGGAQTPMCPYRGDLSPNRRSSQRSPLNSSSTSFSTVLFWEKLFSFFSSSAKPGSGLQNIQLSKLGRTKQR